jgi:hypothetical protein
METKDKYDIYREVVKRVLDNLYDLGSDYLELVFDTNECVIDGECDGVTFKARIQYADNKIIYTTSESDDVDEYTIEDFEVTFGDN